MIWSTSRRFTGHFLLLATVLAPAVSGCELAGGPDVLDVRPADCPTLGQAKATRSRVTSLIVVTETFRDIGLASGDDGTRTYHTGYTLYDEHGRRLQYVRNYVGTYDYDPTTIELEPGRYLVMLDKPGISPPVFWVVLEPGKLTKVDLPQ